MRIVWTTPALRDLDAAREFIGLDNPPAARRQIEAVFGAVTALHDFPNLGRNGRRLGTRELVISGTPYILAYRVHADVVEVLRVLHGRRRWPDRL